MGAARWGKKALHTIGLELHTLQVRQCRERRGGEKSFWLQLVVELSTSERELRQFSFFPPPELDRKEETLTNSPSWWRHLFISCARNWEVLKME